MFFACGRFYVIMYITCSYFELKILQITITFLRVTVFVLSILVLTKPTEKHDGYYMIHCSQSFSDAF